MVESSDISRSLPEELETWRTGELENWRLVELKTKYTSHDVHSVAYLGSVGPSFKPEKNNFAGQFQA